MNKDCRHIKTNGHKCGSTAVREEHYCYYHPRRLRAAWPSSHDGGVPLKSQQPRHFARNRRIYNNLRSNSAAHSKH
jgi:hypothetical protein